MRTFIYIVWGLFPLFFFLMALWALLEKAGNRQKKENPGDFFKQGLFVLACVLISVVIDRYVLDSLATDVFGDILPVTFYRVILLPLVFYIGALVLGPSKAILINQSPRPSQGKVKVRPPRQGAKS